jgi:hypothetical protein
VNGLVHQISLMQFEFVLTRQAEVQPPVFLRLAGHPVRWRLLRERAHSDLRVHELTALAGKPQNAVSYHLARLRAGGRAGVDAPQLS